MSLFFLQRSKRAIMGNEEKAEREVGVEENEEEEEEEREKWVKYYSSNHQILLVGEGDFSFSLSLAQSFGSASNIIASSLDPFDVVTKKYKKAKSNLENLQKLGASLLQRVDATRMKLHMDLQKRKFDRIIFNFPHAGFRGKEDNAHMIEMHRKLLLDFFRNASAMLRANGEIHVNHKTSAPFCHWNLEELACKNSLALIGCVEFKIEDYPGYNNKRGDGLRCDMPCPLGECSTFKFSISPSTKKISGVKSQLGLNHRRSQLLQEIPIQMHQQPTSVDFTLNMSDFTGYVGSPLTIRIRGQGTRFYDGYFNHVAETFGRTGYDVGHSVHNALRPENERYMAAAPGRTLNGDIYYSHESHRLSIMRSFRQQRLLFRE